MSTHNIGFYEEISKIIPQLSSNIKYEPYLCYCEYLHKMFLVRVDKNYHSIFAKYLPKVNFLV